MSFLDSLLGRSKPVKANLDDLFALPTAAPTLQAAMGLISEGQGAVCFKAAEGAAFATMQAEVEALIAADGGPAEQVHDPYGYTWLVCKHDPDDLPGLVTDLHAINSSLEAAGFGSALLCSVIGFTGRVNGVERTGGPGLPLQARHVLPVRAAGRSASRQCARAAAAQRDRRRPEVRDRPRPLVPGLGRTRALSVRVGVRRSGRSS